MGRNGKSLVRDRFTWNSAGPKLMELYMRVVSQARAAGVGTTARAGAIGIGQ
jgi:hypothetical protein